MPASQSHIITLAISSNLYLVVVTISAFAVSTLSMCLLTYFIFPRNPPDPAASCCCSLPFTGRGIFATSFHKKGQPLSFSQLQLLNMPVLLLSEYCTLIDGPLSSILFLQVIFCILRQMVLYRVTFDRQQLNHALFLALKFQPLHVGNSNLICKPEK